MSIVAILPVASMLAANATLETAGKYYVYAHLSSDGMPFYIGKGYGRRHLITRRRNPHHTRCLAKHGLESLILYDGLGESDAMLMEMHVIAEIRRQGTVLANYTDGGQGSSGYKHTPEALEKMRIASTGRTPSQESIAKCLVTRAGYRHPEEVKGKISRAHQGKVFSLESRQKMSASQKEMAASPGYKNPRAGVTLSDATKEKLRLANLGKTIGQETRRKMSEALKGRTFSDEHKRKIGVASRERARIKREKANG